MMRNLTLIAIAAGSLGWFAQGGLQAADRNPFQLPQHSAVVAVDGSSATVATPVRWGWGWRGPSYYPGYSRPYGSYYRGYYGNYYRPYYGGYYRPYSGYYRSPYYYGYRGGYRYY